MERLKRLARVVLRAMQTSVASSPASTLPGALLDAVRSRWVKGVQLRSEEHFALIVSFAWLALYNVRFWEQAAGAMWHGTPRSALFLVSLFALSLSAQALLLLLMPMRRLMLAVASACFIVAAASSYFSLEYGAVMNKDMLRNVFETDVAETEALMTVELWLRVILMGVVPALLVWKVRLPRRSWAMQLRRRSIAIGALLAVCAVALLSSAASYAVFFREHKPVRFLLTPAAPVSSALGLLFDEQRHGQGPFVNASGVAERSAPPQPRPLVLVLVVGETARAANFQLGGYARPTTPQLAAIDGLVYFPQTTSCGTSTAISVPCMFSHLPRSEFDVEDAPRYANLLDALKSASVDVEWRENNSGCKGVCARVAQIDYTGRCGKTACFDEVMLEDLPARLNDVHHDTVIVMHQVGSHGPAYTERYPAAAERFKPACRSNELQRCTKEEVVNAYDNTIAYTDQVLARAIGALRDASGRVDAALMYVSDHGESLGEGGVYLHGVPYAFAPEAQTHVPMLMWLSPAYVRRSHIDLQCLAAYAEQPFSHDNVYHTVLGAAEVRNASYDRSLDILSHCRTPALPPDHE